MANFFGYNIIDGLIILFLLFYVWSKRNKGFLYETLDLVGFLLSLILALKFYRIAANFLIQKFSLTLGFANAIGFILISFLAEPTLFILLTYVSQLIPKNKMQSQLNKSLFFIPAFLSGLILVAFLITAVLSLPIRPDVKYAIAESKFGGIITDSTRGFEKTLSDIFGGAVQDSLNFLTVKEGGEESIKLNFTESNTTTDNNSENIMFNLVNNERSSKSLKALVSTLQLTQVARSHCQDMFARGYFSHYTPDGKSPFDRMSGFGISYSAAGENLAYAPTVQIAHRGLMESPGHRANILSVDFGHVGIGVIDGGIYGKMFCQEFTN